MVDVHARRIAERCSDSEATDPVERWWHGSLSSAAKPPPAIDGLMAATAKGYRLTLVTRNAADVARTGVAAVNPFQPA